MCAKERYEPFQALHEARIHKLGISNRKRLKRYDTPGHLTFLLAVDIIPTSARLGDMVRSTATGRWLLVPHHLQLKS